MNWRSILFIPFLASKILASGLTSEEIQKAVEEATRRYRGDFVEGIAPSGRTYFHGSITRDIREKYLSVFAEFSITRHLTDKLTRDLAAPAISPGDR